MSQTVFGKNDPKTQKKWSSTLAVDQAKKSYFERKFVGEGPNNIIQRRTELESSPGDRVSYDLSVQLRGQATEGDARLEGKEEQLRFYTDEVRIDQTRHAVSAGGQMTRKRTSINLRKTAKDRLADYWSMFNDELMFIYLSGARGINPDFHFPENWAGRAGNPLEAPDDKHLLFGGSATSKATLTSSDKMSRNLIERACTQATMMQALDGESANMVPVTVEGEERYVLLMSPFQAFDLRTDTGTNGWMDIQKAAAASEGSNNRIFKGGLGMIDNCILHKHRNVIRFNDYGAGGDVPAARALFMGRQAGAVAYGTKSGMRWSWKETMKDYDNEPTVAAGFIGGFKKTRFNEQDFGVLSLDTAAANPNA